MIRKSPTLAKTARMGHPTSKTEILRRVLLRELRNVIYKLT
jgi:hypothetical protein